jgi:quercetin dioxygenase-like cupin family protein
VVTSASDDRYASWIEAFALGSLDGAERAEMEAHLASGCAGCNAALRGATAAAAQLPSVLPVGVPSPTLREQVLDLAHVSSLGDWKSHPMVEGPPGVFMYLHRQDPSRNMRACLVRVRPGVTIARHRHDADEVIFVLQGALRDERGRYGPGEICRSLPGSVHSEEALPGEDCVCYVLYYGENHPLE